MTTKPVAASLDEVFDDPAPESDLPLLSLRDVSVHFGGVRALSGVDLDVWPHDVAAIVGPNGAGKTTVLNAISGLVRSSGRITFHGRELSALAPSRMAALRIGRSFQDPPLIDHYTVLENALCGAHVRLAYSWADQLFRRGHVKDSEQRVVRRARILLDFAGLAASERVEAGALPFGSRKLVDIVRAMIGGPRLLLLDEPSSGLDSHEREALGEMLLALRATNRVAILAVEHHMDLVRRVAHRVTALEAGSVVMSGSAADVLGSEEFLAVVSGASSARPVADASKVG
jgi:branched-chain amino acid transport system ATP-binding protein